MLQVIVGFDKKTTITLNCFPNLLNCVNILEENFPSYIYTAVKQPLFWQFEFGIK